MNKIDFFKAACRAGCFKSKNWMLSAFSLIKENEDAYKSNPFPFRIIQSQTGFFFIDPSTNELVRIEDAKPGEPLFKFSDPIELTSDDVQNVIEPVQTKIGQMLFNLICIVNAFGSKIPFLQGKIKVSKIEDLIAPKLQDTPASENERKADLFYVDEYLKFIDSLSYLIGLSQLCVWAATERNIVGPEGINEFKAALIKKYDGKLNDPVELAKFEKELKDYDSDYLKDDPANGVFISGKVKDVARKKMFLSIGAGDSFDTGLKVNPILNSLQEGWPTDADSFTAMINSVRVGSYSRGSETVNGGVSAKILLRAAGNLKIVPGDCGTNLGIRRKLDSHDIGQLVGRSVREGLNWIVVESDEQARHYQDKEIVVRSFMYCKLDGDNLCEHCAGHRLAKNPLGLSMTLTEISSTIILTSMKKMHGTVLSTAKMDYRTALS